MTHDNGRARQGESREAESGLPDSGHRVEFDNGARREMAPGKGRFDLISPVAMRKLAELLEKGAVKYDARNWEKGLPLHSFIDSGKRHLDLLLEGDTSEDHAVAALWNMMALVHTQEMIRRRVLPPDLDDLPNYQAVPPECRPSWAPDPLDITRDQFYRHPFANRVCRLSRNTGNWIIHTDGPEDTRPLHTTICYLTHESMEKTQ